MAITVSLSATLGGFSIVFYLFAAPKSIAGRRHDFLSACD